jgi:NitT/TauT family transport system ATP-binding protein
MVRQGTVTSQRPAAAVGAVRLTGVSKVFGRGSSAVRALEEISLDVPPGEFTCPAGTTSPVAASASFTCR